jgi:hypothetical protein
MYFKIIQKLIWKFKNLKTQLRNKKLVIVSDFQYLFFLTKYKIQIQQPLEKRDFKLIKEKDSPIALTRWYRVSG